METENTTPPPVSAQTEEDDNNNSITLIAKWGKERIELPSLNPQTTISQVKEMLMERTNVLPKRQKFIGLATAKSARVTDDEVLANLKAKGKKRSNGNGNGNAASASASTSSDGIATVVHSFIMMGTAEKNIFVDQCDRDDRPEVIDDFDLDFNAGSDEWIKHVGTEINLKKFTESTKITIINEPRPNKPLMVLDLDHTLLDFSSKRIINGISTNATNAALSTNSSTESAAVIARMKRPHMDEFLTKMYPHYDLVVWSQTSWRWLETKLTELGMLTHPGYKWCFVLDKTSMFQITSERRTKLNNGKASKVNHYVKPLQIIWSKFPGRWGKHNTVHLDDLSRNFALNLENGLKVTGYYRKRKNSAGGVSGQGRSSTTDVELVGLGLYLEKLALEVDDFTKVDFRYWMDVLSGKRKIIEASKTNDDDDDTNSNMDDGGGKKPPANP